LCQGVGPLQAAGKPHSPDRLLLLLRLPLLLRMQRLVPPPRLLHALLPLPLPARCCPYLLRPPWAAQVRTQVQVLAREQRC